MPDGQPVTNAELRAALDAVVETIAARQDRAVETIAGEISAFRTEVSARFDTVGRRLERTENNTNALLLQTAGISRSLTFAERFDTETSASLAAQRQAIEDLARRVAALEKKAS